MLAPRFEVRRAETIADYRACQDAQRRAWGITEDGYIVPVATMVGAQLHGGLVLGAFLPTGEAIGLSFAFLGRIEDRLCLYSQLTGVVPGYQGHGLGERLKLAQFDHAREHGIDWICWAFDPLQAGNAHFNLAKLGATVGRWVDDMYGARTDALNASVPTDRVIAEWPTVAAASPSIPDRDDDLRLPRVIVVASHPNDPPVVADLGALAHGSRALVEIPDDIASLRSREPALAEAWRQAVRQALRTAFAKGYRAIGFVRDTQASPRRHYYVIGPESPP